MRITYKSVAENNSSKTSFVSAMRLMLQWLALSVNNLQGYFLSISKDFAKK